MSNYWEDRWERQKKFLLGKTINQTENHLATLYKKAMKDTENQLKSLLYEIDFESGDRIIDIYKYNRYWEVRNDVNERLRQLGQEESKQLSKDFLDMYVKVQEYFNIHPKVMARTQRGLVKEMTMRPMDLKSPIVGENAMKVVSSVWCKDGKNWSDRVWTHIDQLQQDLEQGLTNIVATGANPDKLTSELSKTYNVNYRQAQTLVRTELSHIYNQASLDRYAENGIYFYEWLTAGDERTCEDCAELNGKVFSIEEAIEGDNQPPLHPNCLCTVIPVLGGDNV